MSDVMIDEICCVAMAEAFRGDGEILCNPIGTVPIIGGRLARATFEPDLMMTDTVASLVANTIPVGVAPGEARSPLSWSAAIAGALAATAVTFIIVTLGSGIGLSFASPYGGPSVTSMTIAAAVWLVMAETMGFATGGYLAGRLRSPAYDGVVGEITFRDVAQGLLVWRSASSQ